MKKPRIADFDPAAAERELGSPLDDMPAIKPPASKTAPQRTERAIPAIKSGQGSASISEPVEPTLSDDNVVPRHHDTVTPRYHDTKIPRSNEDILEVIRKAVRQVGKEPATQRLTLEEKQQLKDIEYTYDRAGIKTSSNEVIRIAINFIVNDYATNGRTSVLARVLEKLNS